MKNWPAGKFLAAWYDPASGAYVDSSQGVTTNGNLTLTLPDFTEDLAGIVFTPPTLNEAAASPAGDFQFTLNSEPGGRYQIQRSYDLNTWTPILTVTNLMGELPVPTGQTTNAKSYFRAKRNP